MSLPLTENKPMGTNGQKRKQRTISVEMFAQWKANVRVGDAKRLVELLKVSKPTIDNALAYGHANRQDLIDAITSFFADRLMAERDAALQLKELKAQVDALNKENASA